MPVNGFGTFDLGEVLGNAERIKHFQKRSQLADLQELALRQNIDNNQEDRTLARQQFSAEQQQANTERLYNAVQVAKERPEAIPHIARELAQAGILDPQALPQIDELARSNPDQLMAMINEMDVGLAVALGKAPEKPEQFNLAKGAQRVDSTGRVIAENVDEDAGAADLSDQIALMQAQIAQGRFEMAQRAEQREIQGIEATATEKAEEARQKAGDKAAIGQMAADLFNNKHTKRVFGLLDSNTPTVRQATVDAEAGVEQLINLLSLENREKLKGSGTISNFEAEMLGRAATILNNPEISDEAAAQALADIAMVFAGVELDPAQAFGKTAGRFEVQEVQ